MRRARLSLLWPLVALLAGPIPWSPSRGAAAPLSLRRVGHRAVQMPGLSDGPANPHFYFSVVAFDSGEVVPLNVWYHPQLFRFHPESGALVSRAFMYPHQGLGNEDDVRWRIRAHKGPSAAASFFLWSDVGYEEIDGENGTLARDAAIFSSRPVEASPGVMPERQARVVNMGAEASGGFGPGVGGLDYDPIEHLVFVSMDRSDTSSLGEIFQVYRLDTTTGAFEGRVRVSKPTSDARQLHTFLRVDPVHRVVMFQIDNPWEPTRDLLYLARYTPTGGSDLVTLSDFQVLEGFYLAGHDGDPSYLPAQARAAVLAERNGRLRAVLGANGLYVFDLGPAAGPYTLARPVGRVPLPARVEGLKIVEDQLLVSARGLLMYDLGAVLDVTGEQSLPHTTYRLPYPTYELDTATIGGNVYLFLAAGSQGIDVFRLTANGSGLRDGTIQQPQRRVDLRRGPGTIVLETGGGLRHLGSPATNDRGDLAVWAVTDNQREVIVLKRRGESAQTIADTAAGAYVSFSRPSINSMGEVAFWAAKPDGQEAILQYRDQLSEVVSAGGSISYLRQPEIADTGDILYLRNLAATGRSELVVRKADGSTVSAYAENDSYDFDRGLPYTSFHGDYDIAPNGEVAFNRLGAGGTLLSLWSDGTLTDLLTDQRVVSHVRFASSSWVTSRTWAQEITRLQRVGPAAPAKSLADRRSTYQGYIFGNFAFAAANDTGDTVFAAPKYVVPTMGPENVGYSLAYYREAAPALPDLICAPTDPVDGRTVRNVDFVDAFTASGRVTFAAELEAAGGDVGIAVIEYNVGDVASGADGGAASPDAGAPVPDAGPGVADAGPSPDAGAPPADGGASPARSQGCGCTAPASNASGLFWVLLLLGAVWAMRRAR